MGTCTYIPEVCMDITDYVCGCDGKTYKNSCAAHMWGVNVAKMGKC